MGEHWKLQFDIANCREEELIRDLESSYITGEKIKKSNLLFLLYLFIFKNIRFVK